MKPYVITLSRQFASMGRAIAQSMSGELGINFYDRDIVEETAKRLGLSVSYVSKVEETGASFFTNLRYPLGMGLISTQKETFEIQSNIIRDLAQKESCIIVGRCADSVLRDHPRCLNIYIYAPYEKRLANCIREYGMDASAAKRAIAEVDRAREIYRLPFSGDVRSVLDHRHIMLDSSRFGVDLSAKILSDIARRVFSD